MKKTLTIIALAAATAVSLSACGTLGNTYDKRETKTFSNGASGKADGALPSWVPDGATDIKMMFRTTGAERIMVLKNGSPLPTTCTAVPAGQKPVSGEDSDNAYPAKDFSNGPATLSADWWPSGTEQKASSVCGRWWVTTDGDKTYAYAPETTQIVQEVQKEQKK